MSLSTIVSELEAATVKGVADLKNVADAVDHDPVVQAALQIAEDVLPEVRTAISVLMPSLTGAPVPVLQALGTIVQAMTAGHAASAPAPQPAAA